MKILTVIILYDDNSKDKIEPLKAHLLENVDANDINIVTYFSEDDKYIIKDIDTLNEYDSKYLTVVNAQDMMSLFPDIIETLKENNYYMLYDDFLKLKNGEKQISFDYETEEQIYNKIIRIDYLKKVFKGNNVFINDILYENYPDEESFRYFNLRYTFTDRPFPVKREREEEYYEEEPEIELENPIDKEN